MSLKPQLLQLCPEICFSLLCPVWPASSLSSCVLQSFCLLSQWQPHGYCSHWKAGHRTNFLLNFSSTVLARSGHLQYNASSIHHLENTVKEPSLTHLIRDMAWPTKWQIQWQRRDHVEKTSDTDKKIDFISFCEPLWKCWHLLQSWPTYPCNKSNPAIQRVTLDRFGNSCHGSFNNNKV